MSITVFIQHADSGAMPALVRLFQLLRMRVYATYRSPKRDVDVPGIHIVPSFAAKPARFTAMLMECGVVILSEGDPEEAHAAIDVLEERRFVGHIFLIATMLSWAHKAGGREFTCAQFTERVKNPRLGGLYGLESRVQALLTGTFYEGASLHSCIRGAIVVHGLLYDCIAEHENYLLELAHYTAQAGTVLVPMEAEERMIPISSACRVAMEVRNVLQNTVEQGIDLTDVCPYRFVVDDNISQGSLARQISLGVFGTLQDLHPMADAEIQLLHLSELCRLHLLCNLKLERNPLDDFSYANFLSYARHDATCDEVLAAVQGIMTDTTTTDNPQLFFSPTEYIQAHLTYYRPRHSVVLLGNDAGFETEAKAQLLYSRCRLSPLSLENAVHTLVRAGEDIQLAQFWTPLLKMPTTTATPVSSTSDSRARGKVSSTEPMGLDEKCAFLVRVLVSLPIVIPQTERKTPQLVMSLAIQAIRGLPIPDYPVLLMMLYSRLVGFGFDGYVFLPGNLTPEQVEKLYRASLEEALEALVVDQAWLPDPKKAGKGETLVTSLPEMTVSYAKERRASPPLIMNPLLCDVVREPKTGLMAFDCYSTYKLLSRVLGPLLTRSIRTALTVQDDRCLVTPQAWLPGSFPSVPTVIDVSPLTVPINVFRAAYILSVARPRLTTAEGGPDTLLRRGDLLLTMVDELDKELLEGQLNVLRRLIETEGQHSRKAPILFGDSSTATELSSFTTINSLRLHFGPERLHTLLVETPPTPPSKHVGVAPSLPFTALDRVTRISERYQAYDLTRNCLAPLPAVDLYPLRIPSLLSYRRVNSVEVDGNESSQAIPPVMLSLLHLVSLLSDVKARGDLNEYEDVEDFVEVGQESSTRVHDSVVGASVITHSVAPYESVCDESEEDDPYPNTADGNITYLREMVGAPLSRALGLYISLGMDGKPPPNALQFIADELLRIAPPADDISEC
ncbi:hypothetical protein GMRT_12457 [Giardia muris]|uniref:Uncharacterized protein n=1 Tax=Giardia muris TaxID=5742 RepID=A0A4Z1T0P4_GIAMU|nr:hypothetical protein GMRT_12457 [Giardia muris]|eukprot:TNJ27473.1 hypothetical protein GMRT_12457 [Giardia muris]